MYAIEKFQDEVRKSIEEACGENVNGNSISVPPDPKLGDLSCTIAFELAKKWKKNPREVAEGIAGSICKGGLIADVKTVGPYINFFINWGAFNRMVLEEATKDGYGKAGGGQGKVMIEYSAPNPNKAQHLGHLRNNLLGMAIARLLEANGKEVVKANLINNRGITICKAMLGYKKWGHNSAPENSGKRPDQFIDDYYVMFEKKAEEDESLQEEAQEMLRKWEAGDEETIALWERIIKWADQGREDTYRRLGTEFDVYFYEEQMYKRGKEIIREGLEKRAFEEDGEGAIIAPLEKYGLPDKVLLRPDGTSIYATNDIALAFEKLDRFNPDESVYIVGADHKTYFEQLFQTLRLLGYPLADRCRHLWYGMVYLEGEKMSSRKGRVIMLNSLLDDVFEAAKYETARRNPDAKDGEIERMADIVCLGAVKFAILKTDMQRDVHFSKAESLRFDGDTGPYIQYAYARSNSILGKAEGSGKVKPELLKTDEESALLKKIAQYPEAIRASGNYQPHILCNYLLELVHTYSSFYENCPVAKAEDDLKATRIQLIRAFQNVVRGGLRILGIEAPVRM